MKKIMVIALATLISGQTWARCEDFYTRKINEVAGRMNPARTTVLVNLGAEAAVVGALAATGTVITVGSVVALPAVAVGAGTYLGALAAQKRSFTQALLTLKQAEAGSGPIFNKFVRKITKKNKSADKEMIRSALLRLNAENAFCQENAYTGKVKISKFGKMRKQVLAEI